MEGTFMIWMAHKKYTPEHYATKLEEIRNHVRISTRHMGLVVFAALTLMLVADATCLYCL